ncbi:MAG TPA: sulfurtransferase-like selenium metabolism protein YedF [Bacillota bacterium]|mgnify:FL=1|jgi:selenium metabolism protein YedF|nr:sulfurtransferase-like selenium metabolism protein YedF [Bacillota bacterium]HQC48453.1 sulfurtransferase-like selenium metabolism protein YedF [Bacillota bacterium]
MIQVNAVGDACPLPVIKVRKALEQMTSGELEVLVDNDVAVQNIERFAKSRNCAFSYEGGDGTYTIRIVKPDDSAAEDIHAQEDVVREYSSRAAKNVVAIASDKMGRGDDVLGDILMKSFFFTLTQLDESPHTLLLYNAGAKLSIHGSPVLKDLIALDQAGVRIMTCGTCLNHFGIADQLAVGEITNMYDIVDQLRTATHIIRP